MKSLQSLSYKTLFAILFFALAGIVFFLKIGGKTSKVSAAWWDDAWHYRKAISIDNSSGSDLTDFQVALSIGTSQLIADGKMQTDCDDIRITDINGNLLPYWIEENNPGCNSPNGDTKVWVKASSLPTSGSTVYIYYGNSSAETISNVTNTFGPLQKLSLGTSYTVAPSPHASYPDTNGIQLTNGLIREEIFSSTTESTVGWLNQNPTISINLGRNAVLSYFKLYLGGGGGGGINIPSQIQTKYSTDGTNFNSIGIGNTWSNIEQWVTINNNSLIAARYGQAIITDSTWAMVGEVEIYGYPGSATLADTSSTLQSEETGGGPIAYWKFDEGVGTTAYDSAGNNHGVFGTGSSAPTWADESQCISGTCLSFDGTSNYIDVTNLTSSGNTYTFSFWIYSRNSTTGAKYFFDIASGRLLFGWGSDTAGKIGIYDGSWKLFGNSPNINSWHHVEFVLNGSTSIVKMYLDGSQYGSDLSFTPHSISGSVSIGSRFSKNSNFFSGLIDEVKIYPYARTADQIKQDYNSRGSASSQGSGVNMGTNKNNNTLSDGLVGYWKMDEGIGTTITDSSGNNKTGTFVGGGLWTTSGKFGIGASFPGSVYINLGTNIVNPTAYTKSAWIKTNTQNANNIFSGASGGHVLYVQSGNIYLCNTWSSPSITVAANFYDNNWHLITATYDGTKGIIYMDGVKLAEGNLANIPANQSAYIGAYAAGTQFNGLIDEVRLYNRALSPTEVSALYNYSPGPVGYWDFNDGSGTSVVDKSGNNNNGTLINSPIWTQGKIGSGLNFDGASNKYVSLPNTFSNLGKGSLTVSGWVNIPSDVSVRVGNFLGNYNDSPHMNFEVINAMRLFWNGGEIDQQGTTNLKDNQWHYITYIRDKNSNNFYMYVDGKLEKTISGTGSDLTFTTPFYIGSDKRSGGKPWHGKIDDVKIYNYARTQKQIIEDMNAGKPAASAKSMIAHYKFDEGSGTTVNNSGLAGSALNGTFGTGSSAPTWTQGKIGKALSFDGTNDYINCGSSVTSKISGDYTISTWINTNSVSGTKSIISFSSVMDLMLSGNSIKLEQAYDGSFASGYNLISSSAISTNSWHHIVGIHKKDQGIWIYVNGKLVGSSTSKTGTTPNISGNLYIGPVYSLGAGYFFNGLIDDVKIYNYALTADEVKQDYNQGSAISFGSTSQTIGATTTSLEYCIPGDTSYCASPVAEWKMDEGSGTSITDTSGNNYTSTFVGSPSWVQGKIGKAISFNGTTNGISLSGPTTYAHETMSAWVYIDSSSPSGDILGNCHTNANSQYGFTFYLDGNTLRAKAATNGVTYFYDNITYDVTSQKNKWLYLTMTWDNLGTGTNGCDATAKLYVNGQLVDQDTANFSGGYDCTKPYSYPFSMGGTTTNSLTRTTKVKLDQVKVYNYSRTPAQIAYDYNKGAPVGWWKFDECQGNIAYDWSGIGNTGSINIGPSGTQNSLGTCQIGTSAAWTNGATGKVNSSLNFDGVDDYVNVGDPSNGSLDFGANSFSYGLWVYVPSSVGAYDMPIYKGGSSAGNPGYDIELGTGSWIANACDTDTTCISVGFGNETTNLNQWIHIMVIIDKENNLVKSYKNGKLINSVSATGLDSLSNSTPLYIGYNYYKFKGQLDDVRIYNYALTSEQIKQVYNGGAVNFN